MIKPVWVLSQPPENETPYRKGLYNPQIGWVQTKYLKRFRIFDDPTGLENFRNLPEKKRKSANGTCTK